MVVIQACQISDGGTPYVLQTCQYVALNKKPPFLQCSFFIENNLNFYSHFIAFSSYLWIISFKNLKISYLMRVFSHCWYSFGCLDLWNARSAKIFGAIFLDRWSYCHFLAGDDGHTGSLHEWWWWIPNFDQVMDGHYKRTPPPLCTYAFWAIKNSDIDVSWRSIKTRLFLFRPHRDPSHPPRYA